jgi:8-oxo-dGTP diphosphatase
MAQTKLERPVLSVDVVAFRVDGGELTLLLHRRSAEPFAGAWTLPGVAVRMDETLEAAAKRALAGKVGFDEAATLELHLEQLFTFDSVYRDPRGRTVSVAYLGLARTDPLAKSSPDVTWKQVGRVDRGSLPFDHAEILETAITRLQGKLRYTNIAARLLPETFRIEELQAIYEAVLGHAINRTNFRNKLLKIGLIDQVGVLSEAVGRQGGRPPHLYRLAADELEALERDFL